MGDVLRIKQQLTGAKTSIDKGTDILDALATAVRAQLTHVELLLAAAGEDAPETPPESAPAAPAEEAPSVAASKAAADAVAANYEAASTADDAAPAADERPAAGLASAAARLARPLPEPYPGAEQLPF